MKNQLCFKALFSLLMICLIPLSVSANGKMTAPQFVSFDFNSMEISEDDTNVNINVSELVGATNGSPENTTEIETTIDEETGCPIHPVVVFDEETGECVCAEGYAMDFLDNGLMTCTKSESTQNEEVSTVEANSDSQTEFEGYAVRLRGAGLSSGCSLSAQQTSTPSNAFQFLVIGIFVLGFYKASKSRILD